MLWEQTSSFSFKFLKRFYLEVTYQFIKKAKHQGKTVLQENPTKQIVPKSYSIFQNIVKKRAHQLILGYQQNLRPKANYDSMRKEN